MLPLRWSTARPVHWVRIVLGALLVLVVVAFTAYGLLATRNTADSVRAAPVTATANPTAPVTVTTPTAPATAGLSPILGTGDPVAFATAVARALFDWDTTGSHTLADHKGRLLAVADPTGVESPGLVADLGGYLPSAQTWDFLAGYETRQWIDVTNARVPDQWHAVVAAGSGLAPRTTAVTVTGVRHRAGTWEGDEVTARFDVAFTAVVVCGPTYPRCYLLRLSRLDEPLR